ncbi:MAG: NAD(P)/FAD-dependent oxidoreductase [Clostridiales bacterium]|jgi:NADH dehydrogenase|nr:NAD(P)/FAD-dependent oxidoreductase [Clostridiales bacterium]
MKKIVVVGAGYAGVLIAKHLAKRIKKLKKINDFSITIIDRHPFHTMLTELHEVAAGRVEEDSIRIGLDKIFSGRGVNVVSDEIYDVDTKTKIIKGKQAEYAYDYMVVAAGSKPAFFNIPGADKFTFTLWSYEDAIKLREHIFNMFCKAATEQDEEKRREYLAFYVVGAGFTGVEMMGELAEYVPVLCERFGIDPKLVRLVEVDILERVCTILPPKQSDKVANRLKKMGVTLLLKTPVSEVGEDSISYKSEGGSTSVKTRTVIWTAGVEGADLPTNLPELSDGETRPLRGRIATDEYLRAKGEPSVYVGGDNIYYIAEGEKNPVPQMVENAEASSKVVAHNIIADALGNGEKQKYAPKFHGVMVCVGGRWGACHLGLPGKFFSLPSFFAMLSKHFVNMLYFLEVLGWNKIFSYLKHEFFTIRDKRSFVGGHLSNRSPSFMLVPLRMFVGFYWLREGILKVMEGWLNGPELLDFWKGARDWYASILNPVVAEAGEAVVDAVASSTVAAAASAPAVTYIDWNIFGIFRVLLVEQGELAFAVFFRPLDWFMENFVIYSTPMSNVMQWFIVLSEILVGLALLGGLFTTAAGAWSIFLQSMFITSTGIYYSTWWMLFAGAAMMFGAGRVLSLDYYVMPLLKKWWARIKPIRRLYLYHD